MTGYDLFSKKDRFFATVHILDVTFGRLFNTDRYEKEKEILCPLNDKRTFAS